MYIFVSSIGRSGTKYLSEVFSKVTDIPSYHYLEPICYGNTLINYNNNIKDEKIKLKIEKIKKYEKIFEASQIFLRCYVDEALDNLNDIYVIHLTRDPLETARSYTNRGSFPSTLKYPWRLPMNLKKNKLKIQNLSLSNFQKNICDWIENEMRYHSYKHKFNKTYDLYFDEINDINKLKKLFEIFNISYDNDKLKNLFNLKLKKNQNSIKTIVSKEDIKEAKELIQILKRENICLDIFKNSYYKKYEFISWLFE